jgi:hypothetical protein
VGERSGNRRQFGVSSVGIAAGRLKLSAKIFLAAKAKTTAAASRVDPSNPNAIATSKLVDRFVYILNAAHDLVSENHWQARRGRSPFDLVQFSMANTARTHAN